MSQKTRYKVKGKKICLLLSSEQEGKSLSKTFFKGEEFDALPQDVPPGFRDLVENLGPASLEEEESVPLKQELPATPKKEAFVRKTPPKK